MKRILLLSLIAIMALFFSSCLFVPYYDNGPTPAPVVADIDYGWVFAPDYGWVYWTPDYWCYLNGSWVFWPAFTPDIYHWYRYHPWNTDHQYYGGHPWNDNQRNFVPEGKWLQAHPGQQHNYQGTTPPPWKQPK
jgi:hypothetical protein